MQASNGLQVVCESRHALVVILLAGILIMPCLHASTPQNGPALPSASQDSIAIGSAALAQGDNARAEKAFRQALTRDPDSVPLLNNFALSLARQNRNAEAIALYLHALALKPRDAVTERNLGVAYFRAHQFAEARPFLVRVAASAPNFQSLELAGLDLFAMDRYSDAATYLEHARALQPDDLENLHMLGQAYLRLKNYAGITEIFTHIMAIDPNSAEAHAMLATAYDKLFREQEAIREFEIAERIDPTYPGVHTGLGVIYWRLEEMDLARQQFTLALQQAAADPIANCTMGRILRREGKLHEAIRHFEAALAVNNAYEDALREIGQSWIALQEPAKAIPFLRRAAALDPTKAETHFILGTALRDIGQLQAGSQERAKAASLLSEQHITRSPVSEERRLP